MAARKNQGAEIHVGERLRRHRRLVEERNVPIVGNGDVLTWYDARDRIAHSGVAAMMVGRGALIKPWIFKEFAEGREWLPTALERVGVYYTLRTYRMESFGDDDIGKRRYDDFMPWHMGFFVATDRFRRRSSPDGSSTTRFSNRDSISRWTESRSKRYHRSSVCCDAPAKTRTRRFQRYVGGGFSRGRDESIRGRGEDVSRGMDRASGGRNQRNFCGYDSGVKRAQIFVRLCNYFFLFQPLKIHHDFGASFLARAGNASAYPPSTASRSTIS